jgi:hypothetical protein
VAAKKNVELIKQAMETELIARGYVCKERAKFENDCIKYKNVEKLKNPPRFGYIKGSLRVLTESRDNPWWTVQKLSGSSVEWHVDFPFDVGVEAVFAFIDVASPV